MAKNRTTSVVKSARMGILYQLVNTTFSFLTRTVFIKVFGAEYLGVNSLFTNILSVLSFVELGIGTALTYNLYKPIAENNIEEIKSLMALYKKSYRCIAAIVFGVGICIMPFLHMIIGNVDYVQENIYLIYLLFLINSSVSYLYSYKTTFITANQEDYIRSFVTTVIMTTANLLEMAVLIVFKRYLLYLIMVISFTILNNVVLSMIAGKKYPYLKDKNVKELDKEETKTIFENVRSLAVYKFCSVVLSGTDNIIISILNGVVQVGIATNFTTLINIFVMFGNQIFSGITAGVGNLIASEDERKQERIYNNLFFFSAWLYGYLAVALMLFLNPVVELWIGKGFLLDSAIVFSLVLNFYVSYVHQAPYIFRTTAGLFKEAQFCPLAASVINFILSIILGYKYGLFGVYIATSISRILTFDLVDPILVYKRVFHKNPIGYYIKYAIYAIVLVALYFMTKFSINLIPLNGFLGLFLKMIVMTLVFNILFVLIFYQTQDFRDLKDRISRLIGKRLKR